MLYQFAAMVVGGFYGIYIGKTICKFLGYSLNLGYYSSTKERFAYLYNITEDNFDLLSDYFDKKTTHAKFVEALRSYHDDAYTFYRTKLTGILSVLGNCLLRLFPYVAVLSLIFYPVLIYFLISLIVGALGYTACYYFKRYKLQQHLIIPMLDIAVTAYKERWGLELIRFLADIPETILVEPSKSTIYRRKRHANKRWRSWQRNLIGLYISIYIFTLFGFLLPDIDNTDSYLEVILSVTAVTFALALPLFPVYLLIYLLYKHRLKRVTKQYTRNNPEKNTDNK